MGSRWLAAAICLVLAGCCASRARPPDAEPPPATRVVKRSGDYPVDRSLMWLATRQRPDGSWSAGDAPPCSAADDVSATALAVLAFHSSGYTHRSEGALGSVMTDGLRWLKRSQDASGRFLPLGTPTSLRHDLLAAAAVLEAYGMTGSALFKAPAQRALEAVSTDVALWMPCRFPVSDDAVEAFGWGVLTMQSARLIDAGDAKQGKSPSLEYDATLLEVARDRLTAMRGEGAATTPTAIAVRAWLTLILGSGSADFDALKRDWATLAGTPSDDPEADLPARAMVFAAHSLRVSTNAPERTRCIERTDRWIDGALVAEPTEHRGMFANRGPRHLWTGAVEATALSHEVDELKWSLCFLKPFRGTDSRSDDP